MKKAINYVLAYLLWVFDLGLALLLFFRSRTLILDLLIVFGDPNNWQYAQIISMIDRFLVVILGLAWLVFMIGVEESFRTGAPGGELFNRFAKITAPILFALFAVDLILVPLQGITSRNWLQWLALAVELGAGTGLLVFYKTRFTSKSTKEIP
jgi:hypothetical protein